MLPKNTLNTIIARQIDLIINGMCYIKMRKILKKLSIIVLFCIFVFLTWFTFIGGTAYFYASYVENSWRKANPKNKKEIEKHLRFYSLHQINPKDSLWGNTHKLRDGERMMQYLILWNKECPLDVVYDDKNRIVAIYTSYE